MGRQTVADLRPWEPPRGPILLQRLADVFESGGYYRKFPDRTQDAGSHHGYEARFSAATARERNAVVALLRALGFRPGRPFAKGPSWRIPVYGEDQVRMLQLAVQRGRDASSSRSR